MAIAESYPSDITQPYNEFRCLKILVKEQESLNGGIDELKKKLEATAGDIGTIVDSLSGKNQPSDETKQAGLAERTKKLVNATTVYGVALPLPNELNDTQTHQWETTKGFVAQAAEALEGVNKIVGELSSQAGMRKPLIDPGYFQDYNGTEPREFSFSWDLIPNNVTEANAIFNILYNLKKYTLPTSTVNGLTMLSPYLFDLEIGNPRIQALMNMNNVVCKSLSINYSAEGSLQFFADGTPKYMKLEMTFAERTTVTADLY